MEEYNIIFQIVGSLLRITICIDLLMNNHMGTYYMAELKGPIVHAAQKLMQEDMGIWL